VKESGVVCEVKVGGVVKDHKGLNFPGVKLSIGSLTAKDRRDVAFAVSAGVDYIAQSFVRSADDVRQLKALLRKHRANLPVIAKIEKPEALGDLDAILREADGIMVARGDLGVELPAQDVPEIQRRSARQPGRNSGDRPPPRSRIDDRARASDAPASDVPTRLQTAPTR
jgi:pyruvate kinase